MSEGKKFNYSYSSAEKKEIEAIRKKYEPKSEEISKLEQIRRLDAGVTKSGTVVSLIIGIVGSLIFGTGMCCIMVWGDKLFALGIIFGVLGMLIASAAYPVYLEVTRKNRKKIAAEIIKLTDEIL